MPISLTELCQNVCIEVAMAADENGITHVDVDEWYDRLADAVDAGLDSARDR